MAITWKGDAILQKLKAHLQGNMKDAMQVAEDSVKSYINSHASEEYFVDTSHYKASIAGFAAGVNGDEAANRARSEMASSEYPGSYGHSKEHYGFHSDGIIGDDDKITGVVTTFSKYGGYTREDSGPESANWGHTGEGIELINAPIANGVYDAMGDIERELKKPMR